MAACVVLLCACVYHRAVYADLKSWVCYFQCHVLPGTAVILCVQCTPWRTAHTQKYCEGIAAGVAQALTGTALGGCCAAGLQDYINGL